MRVSRKMAALALTVVAVAGASALAVVPGTFNPPGTVTTPTVHYGGQAGGNATAFQFVTHINCQPVSQGGSGDRIVTIDEGRDNLSAFVGIAFVPGTGRSQASIDALAALGASQPGDGFSGFPPGTVTLTYRVTNDPAVSGWSSARAFGGQVGPFAATGEFEDNVVACHVVADQLRDFWRASDLASTGTGPLGFPGLIFWPTMMVEFDNTPTSPSYGEFYKYRIKSCY